MMMLRKLQDWRGRVGSFIRKKKPTYFRKCALSNNAEYIKNVIDDEYAEVFKACDENKKIVGYLTLYLHDCSKEFFCVS